MNQASWVCPKCNVTHLSIALHVKHLKENEACFEATRTQEGPPEPKDLSKFVSPPLAIPEHYFPDYLKRVREGSSEGE